MNDREQELKDAPHRPPNKSTWAKGIRTISMQEADALGTDAKGELYWHGKPIEIRRPLDLTSRQSAVAIIVAAATVFAAIGAMVQAYASLNDTGCKVGWRWAACPPPAQAAPLRGGVSATSAGRTAAAADTSALAPVPDRSRPAVRRCATETAILATA